MNEDAEDLSDGVGTLGDKEASTNDSSPVFTGLGQSFAVPFLAIQAGLSLP